MPNLPKIRILVADNHEVVRCGLKALLAGTEIEVTAEVTTGHAAVKYALDNEVDLVLLDVRMPDGDGLTALGRIKLEKPKLPVVMISAFDNSGAVARAIAMGAAGFLTKVCTREELIDTIRAAVNGEDAWPRKLLRSGSGSLRSPRLGGELEVSLSDREAEVLQKVALGLTNKQIAETLQIDSKTVQVHVHQILRKIGLIDRTQAAVWAVRNDLV